MLNRRIIIPLIVVFLLAISFFIYSDLSSFAEEDYSNIKSQIENIIENQKLILEKLDKIYDELQVVKVRASRK